MKKKYLAPVAIALIAAISITTVSCGKPADEAVNATETEVATTAESMEETTAQETTETETTVEETIVEETTEVAETTKAAVAETTESKKTETKTEKKAEATKAAPKNETKAPIPTQAAPIPTQAVPTPTQAVPAPTQAAPAPTQAPAHEHTWIEHKAIRQEWVTNFVSVPDYAEQEVTVGYLRTCNHCGQTFRDGDGFNAHASTHEELPSYSDTPITEIQVVQVGSHDEDQGYYHDVEYVDYYYCECGAMKQ